MKITRCKFCREPVKEISRAGGRPLVVDAERRQFVVTDGDRGQESILNYVYGYSVHPHQEG